jgi:hypothetical protein
MERKLVVAPGFGRLTGARPMPPAQSTSLVSHACS